jgi:hypothetical protein
VRRKVRQFRVEFLTERLDKLPDRVLHVSYESITLVSRHGEKKL